MRCKRWRFSPWPGRSPGEGNGNPLQFSCLENPMDGGAWPATVHGVAESRACLSDWAYTQLQNTDDLSVHLVSLRHSSSTRTHSPPENKLRISLVVQWLRSCLPVRGTHVDPRPGRCHKPQGSYACVPLPPSRPDAAPAYALLQRSRHNEEMPDSLQLEKARPVCSSEDPAQPKI